MSLLRRTYGTRPIPFHSLSPGCGRGPQEGAKTTYITGIPIDLQLEPDQPSGLTLTDLTTQLIDVTETCSDVEGKKVDCSCPTTIHTSLSNHTPKTKEEWTLEVSPAPTGPEQPDVDSPITVTKETITSDHLGISVEAAQDIINQSLVEGAKRYREYQLRFQTYVACDTPSDQSSTPSILSFKSKSTHKSARFLRKSPLLSTIE